MLWWRKKKSLIFFCFKTATKSYTIRETLTKRWLIFFLANIENSNMVSVASRTFERLGFVVSYVVSTPRISCVIISSDMITSVAFRRNSHKESRRAWYFLKLREWVIFNVLIPEFFWKTWFVEAILNGYVSYIVPSKD